MELDETGFPQPTGELEELEADSLVLALGQETDLSLLDGVPGHRGRRRRRAGRPGHDDRPRRASSPAATWSRPSARSPSAIGHGKKAARNIDAWLRGARLRRPPPSTSSPTFDTLNTWYYADAPRTVAARSSSARAAQSTFDEVVGGLDESTALFEARRCLSCGNCFACDNCYGVCPDNAVHQARRPRRHAYAIDLDYCKGCGICVAGVPVRRDRDGARGDLT